MDYRLAKQLKDSGFLQHGKEWQGFCGKCGEIWATRKDHRTLFHRGRQQNATCEFRVTPTLRELIDACILLVDKRRAGTFQLLFQFADRSLEKQLWWFASFNDAQEKGLTPEEAVAKLWLSLRRTSRRREPETTSEKHTYNTHV